MRVVVTVKGSCGVTHPSFEDWQRCKACEEIDRERRKQIFSALASRQRNQKAPIMDRDLVTWAREYLAMNAAESGADILIEKLSDEVERLRGIINGDEKSVLMR